MTAFVEAFQKQNPGIKVDVIAGGSGELLTRLHPGLVATPGTWLGHVLLHALDHLGDGDGAAAAGVAAQRPVRHELGVDEARVAEFERRQPRPGAGQCVGHDISADGHDRPP